MSKIVRLILRWKWANNGNIVATVCQGMKYGLHLDVMTPESGRQEHENFVGMAATT